MGPWSSGSFKPACLPRSASAYRKGTCGGALPGCRVRACSLKTAAGAWSVGGAGGGGGGGGVKWEGGGAPGAEKDADTDENLGLEGARFVAGIRGGQLV